MRSASTTTCPAAQNLRYTASLNGLNGKAAEEAIEEVLGQVGLTDRGSDKVGTYSRGMRQRLGIADALVKDPDILILDEPTTAIDPIGVQEILELLQSLSRDNGLTILLSSHLLSQVQSVCDRVGIFAAGRLIGQGTVQELAARFMQDEAIVEVQFHEDDGEDLAPRVEAALAALPNVTGVARSERVGRPWHVTVTPATAEVEVREAIPAAAVAAGLRLVALSPHVPSLDDIYRIALRRRAEAAARPAREGSEDRPRRTSAQTDPPARPARQVPPPHAKDAARMTATTSTPPRASARPPIPRAGWAVVASKEIGDHVSSIRFVVPRPPRDRRRHPAVLRG